MAPTLFVLSLVVVTAVVVALVVYLLGIIVALSHANNHLKNLTSGLDIVARNTGPLPEKLGTINGALGELLTGLLAVDSDLATVAHLFGR